MKVERSKTGTPCLWEKGGGMTNTGSATLICDYIGAPKAPIYVKRSGQLACGQHALIPIDVGDLVVEASHHRGDFTIKVFRIDAIGFEGDDDNARLVNHYTFDRGEWDKPLPAVLEAVVEAAKTKATTYHCRSAVWVRETK
jgi:hypothetical protein